MKIQRVHQEYFELRLNINFDLFTIYFFVFILEKILQLFTAFDADKDGFLNGAELQDLAFQVDVLLPQMDLDKCAKEVNKKKKNRSYDPIRGTSVSTK